ncbi:MAG: tetratricopeptide repeat protein [Rhodospirillaceae bacterium]
MAKKEILKDTPVRAFNAYRNRHFETAEQILQDFLEDVPNHADALHMLGLVKQEKEDYSAAKILVENAITINPNNPQYFNNLAIILNAKGDYEAGLIAANKSVFLAPKNAGSQMTRGLLLQAIDRTDDAEAAYRKALELNSGLVQARINLGVLLLEVGDYKASAEMFREAFDKAPHSEQAAAGLVRSLTGEGLYDSAIAVLENIDEFNNQHISVQLALAHAYLCKGDADRAVQFLEYAVTANPENAIAWNDLGYALRNTSNLLKAEEAFKVALDLNPDCNPAAENLSQLYLSQGRFQSGWQLFDKRKGGREPPDYLARGITIEFVENVPTQDSVTVWTEQGLGDELLQASLIPDLMRIVSDLNVVCSDRVKTLFQESFPSVCFTSRLSNEELAKLANTKVMPLINTARELRGDLSSFPQDQGFLTAPKEKVSEMRRTYLKDQEKRALVVGLSWQSGHKLYGEDNTISLDQWVPILNIANQVDRPIIFVSMQYGTTAEYINAVSQITNTPIIFDSAVDHSGDMLDVASQVATADAIITTSTTTAQLAGALGRPTLHMTAQGIACGWYWMAEGGTTPWYPSMQIIRRTEGIDDQLLRTAAAFLELAIDP